MKPEKNTGVEEKKEISFEDRLNTAGFAEFLAKHDDAETFDASNSAETEKRFESFQSKEKVQKGVSEVLQNEIKDSLGIKLEGADLKDLNDHLETLSLNDPEALKELMSTLETFKTLPKEISELEAKIAEKGGTSEKLEAKLSEMATELEAAEKAEKSTGLSGLFSRMVSSETRKDRKDFETKYGSDKNIPEHIKNLKEEFAKTHATKENVAKIEEHQRDAKKMFAENRKNLLNQFSGMKSVQAGIAREMNKEFKSLFDNGSIKSLEQAQVKFKGVQETAGRDEIQMDLSKDLDPKVLQDKIDTKLEKLVAEALASTIKSASLGKNAFSKMETALKPLTGKNELGSKDAADTKEFVLKTLGEESKKTPDKAKKILVNALIAKLSA